MSSSAFRHNNSTTAVIFVLPFDVIKNNNNFDPQVITARDAFVHKI